jgi:hypothetical protein
MKIKMSLLKKIIKESVLLEKMVEPNPLIKLALGTNAVRASAAMKSADNADAFQILPDDRKKLEVTLRVPTESKYYGKPHFIWKESQTGASDKLYNIGSLTTGNGDPFTYEKVSGNKYRVVSGPVSKAIGKTFALSPPPKNKVELPKPDTGETDLAREDDGSEETILDSSALEVFKDAADRFDTAGMSDMSRIIKNWSLTNETLVKREYSLGEYLENIERLISQNLEPSSSVAKEVKARKKSPNAFTPPQNLLDSYADGDVDAITSYIINDILGDYTQEIETAAKQTNNKKILNVLNK